MAAVTYPNLAYANSPYDQTVAALTKPNLTMHTQCTIYNTLGIVRRMVIERSMHFYCASPSVALIKTKIKDT